MTSMEEPVSYPPVDKEASSPEIPPEIKKFIELQIENLKTELLAQTISLFKNKDASSSPSSSTEDNNAPSDDIKSVRNELSDLKTTYELEFQSWQDSMNTHVTNQMKTLTAQFSQLSAQLVDQFSSCVHEMKEEIKDAQEEYAKIHASPSPSQPRSNHFNANPYGDLFPNGFKPLTCLNSRNFSSWSVLVKKYLTAVDKLWYLTNTPTTPEEVREDNVIQYIICNSLSPDALLAVKSASTTCEIWSTLNSKYEDSQASVGALLSRLSRQRMLPHETAHAYVVRIQGFYNDISNLGGSLPWSQLLDIFTDGLSPAYSEARLKIKSSADDYTNFDALGELLNAEAPVDATATVDAASADQQSAAVADGAVVTDDSAAISSAADAIGAGRPLKTSSHSMPQQRRGNMTHQQQHYYQQQQQQQQPGGGRRPMSSGPSNFNNFNRGNGYVDVRLSSPMQPMHHVPPHMMAPQMGQFSNAPMPMSQQRPAPQGGYNNNNNNNSNNNNNNNNSNNRNNNNRGVVRKGNYPIY